MARDRMRPFTPSSAHYLQGVHEWVKQHSPAEVAERIESIVSWQDAHRRSRCLNMNAAESRMSDRCTGLLASDMATRLSEGLPGDKLYPHGQQNVAIDEIEAVVISLIREQFGAKYVEWRPVSTTMANAVVFGALLKHGDAILVQGEDHGGNYSYHSSGPAGLFGARIFGVPGSDTFEVCLSSLAEQVSRLEPKMIVIGGSNVLFPYPLEEIRRIADSVGALVVYDAAHLGLLISLGDFQRPLLEGAHIVTLSTHKIMGGPVGGAILTDDETLAARIIGATFPGFMQTRDQNKLAALAVSLAENGAFGSDLARSTVANARELARCLVNEGFEVLAAERDFTSTHQIFLQLGKAAKDFEERCQAANILVSDCALAGDMARGVRTGARLATHELTRFGMTIRDMSAVAALIGRAVAGGDPDEIAQEVEALVSKSRRAGPNLSQFSCGN